MDAFTMSQFDFTAMPATERCEVKDKRFDRDQSGIDCTHAVFIRLVAKELRFEKVDFRYCIFESAYLRKCNFDSCNFTGCRFVNCNLRGSTFLGCTFDYTTFERTIVDYEAIECNLPTHENLKAAFARSLRVNFQQIGDADAVNKAISLEVKATREHNLKAWRSQEHYYRTKYANAARVHAFFRWLWYEILEMIWGNGESTFKLVRTCVIAVMLIAMSDYFAHPVREGECVFYTPLTNSVSLLMGTYTSTSVYSRHYLAGLVFLRLLGFGLFMSIVVKRLNRR